jgi:hypothetical protein
MRPATTSWSERLYALSLYLLPPNFRREYGHEMRLAFRDRLDERGRKKQSRVAFAFGMMRDVTGSVAREHMAAIEAAPIRSFFWAALIVASAGILATREKVVTGIVDIVVAYTQQRKTDAFRDYDRAVHDYTATIADRLRNDVTARAQLVAAQFYNDELDYFGYRFRDATESTDTSKLAERMRLANVAMSNALDAGRNDAVILWSAVTLCPAAFAVCRADDSLRRLENIVPQNGAVWWLDFNAAIRQGDESRARRAISAMAESTHFDVYESEMVSVWSNAYAVVSPPPRLASIWPYVDSADAVIADGLSSRIQHLEWSAARGYPAFERLCRVDAVRKDCVAAADLMMRSNVFEAKRIGVRIASLVAQGDMTPLHAEWRLALWRHVQQAKLLYAADFENAPSGRVQPTVWLAALTKMGSLTAAADELADATAIAPVPTLEWSDGWSSH